MTQIPEINIHLLNALSDLDIWLNEKSRSLDLKIIGATALHLHHISINRMSMDIDLATDITDDEIKEQIFQIGRDHELGDTWLETPINIQLPTFVIFKEHHLFNSFLNITGSYADLKTMLALKISSYYDRVGEPDGDNDAADIKAILNSGLVLCDKVLEFAIQDIKKSPKYNDMELEQTIKEVKRLAQIP